MNTIQSELQKLQPINLDAGLIFSGQKSGTIVKGYEKPTAFTPKINPNYVFHESVRDLVVWFIATPTPIYVCGAAGSGKSSSIDQLAARLNYPVFEITGHNRLEFQDLIGHHTVENGNSKNVCKALQGFAAWGLGGVCIPSQTAPAFETPPFRAGCGLGRLECSPKIDPLSMRLTPL